MSTTHSADRRRASPPSAGERGWSLRRHLGLLALVLLALTAVGVRWILLFRRGQPIDIDEAAYITIALGQFQAAQVGGLDAWVDAALQPSIQAPLMTSITSVPFALVGTSVVVALMVPVVLGTLMLAATWAAGYRVAGPRLAWWALAVGAAAPTLIIYSRSYNFAIASGATVAAGLAAVACSRNFASTPWSFVAGCCFGLAALSRTVVLSLLPGFALAGVVALLVARGRRRRVGGNLLLVAVGALVVAGPWYWVNGRLVLDYLLSFGYGSRSTEYGGTGSSWTPEFVTALVSRLLSDLAVPMLALVLVGFGILLVRVVRRPQPAPGEPVTAGRLARLGGSPLMPSAVFLAWGLLAFASSGNKPSGFLNPLVPSIALLAGAGLASICAARARALAIIAGAIVLGLNTLANVDLRTPLADRHSVAVPGLGQVTLLDGAGTIQGVIRRNVVPPSDEAMPVPSSRLARWPAASRRVAAKLAADGANASITVFGFRHELLNVNTVQLAELLARRPAFPLVQIAPTATPDQASLTAWLTGDLASACRMLISPGRRFEFLPVLPADVVRGAARDAGFAPTRERWQLPDGRHISVWKRPDC